MLYILSVFFLLISPAKGQNLDSASQKAVKQTINLMRSQSLRNAYIKDHPKAQKADAAVRKLGTPKEQQEVYDLASDIFKSMAKKTSGDSHQMEKLLQKSPKEFFNSLTPEEKRKIKELGDKMSSHQAPIHP